MTLKTAILQTGHAPETLWEKHGDYDAMSKVFLGYDPDEIKTFNTQKSELPKAVTDYDLYLITGSPKGVYDGDPWIAELEYFIRRAHNTNIKMIGVCFGHQIMAQALGGSVRKSPKGYGLGVMDYKFADGETVSLNAWHQDQVEEAPQGAEVILSSEFCPVAGLAYSHNAISFQPHPEFTKAFMDDLISFREGDTITAEQAHKARATLKKTAHVPAIQKRIKRFFNF